MHLTLGERSIRRLTYRLRVILNFLTWHFLALQSSLHSHLFWLARWQTIPKLLNVLQRARSEEGSLSVWQQSLWNSFYQLTLPLIGHLLFIRRCSWLDWSHTSQHHWNSFWNRAEIDNRLNSSALLKLYFVCFLIHNLFNCRSCHLLQTFLFSFQPNESRYRPTLSISQFFLSSLPRLWLWVPSPMAPTEDGILKQLTNI